MNSASTDGIHSVFNSTFYKPVNSLLDHSIYGNRMIGLVNDELERTQKKTTMA